MSCLVSLKVSGGVSIPITVGRSRLQRLAKHWHYVMRSRRRWIDDPDLRDAIQARAISHLNAIGVGQDQLQMIARLGLVQVSLQTSTTLTDKDNGWEARLIPWEYLLASATRKYREGPLYVIRHLDCGAIERAPYKKALNGLFIESGPGRLRGHYNFNIEKEVLERHLEGLVTWTPLTNPSLEEIRQGTGTARDIIHVTGMDSFQGARLLDHEQTVSPTSIKDGMYLRNNSWDEMQVTSQDLACALNADPTKAAVITFNLYNSSARTAAFAVAQGASTAVGFQDYIDDMLAEIFFANFYWQWRNQGCDVLAGFKGGMNAVMQYKDKLQGAGIVLWSTHSLVDQTGVSSAQCPLPAVAGPAPNPSSWIKVEAEPRTELNYSILQNSRKPLFEKFALYKLRADYIRDLEVNVELQIGNERFPYRQMLEMTHHVRNLSEEIGVGLTSELARSLTESVQTTLYVRVKYQQEIIASMTYHVTLLPVDQWQDDDSNRIWLPSFVLPRDPAVLQIIAQAQRYLMALQDDATAGFDGYQGLYDDPDNTNTVDAQVQSLWYALLHEYNLSYINPPPVFTMSAQRLRTPSNILSGRRGTCIDLALMIAACLEFIDVKPVIFLLKGHAFPGYWSSEEAREQFLIRPNPPPLMEVGTNTTPLPDEEQEEEATENFVQAVPWELDKSRYKEVFAAIDSGDLVPVETTLLTNRGSFSEAMEQGNRNLEDPEQFEYMLDIRLAWDSNVTPLPLAKGM